LGRYERVNDNTWHICHKSRIYSNSPGGFFPHNSIMTKGSNHRRRLQSATFRGCVACYGSNFNNLQCVVCDVQSARSLRRRRPPLSAWERDSSRPFVTNVPSVLGNPDYLVTFYQTNIHMICAFGCYHRPSLQYTPDQRPSRVCLTCPTNSFGTREYTMVSARGFTHWYSKKKKSKLIKLECFIFLFFELTKYVL
jgi:hypothetical protein